MSFLAFILFFVIFIFSCAILSQCCDGDQVSVSCIFSGLSFMILSFFPFTLFQEYKGEIPLDFILYSLIPLGFGLFFLVIWLLFERPK